MSECGNFTAEEALPLERKFLDCVKGSDSILNDAIAAVELVVDESHTVTAASGKRRLFKFFCFYKFAGC